VQSLPVAPPVSVPDVPVAPVPVPVPRLLPSQPLKPLPRPEARPVATLQPASKPADLPGINVRSLDLPPPPVDAVPLPPPQPITRTVPARPAARQTAPTPPPMPAPMTAPIAVPVQSPVLMQAPAPMATPAPVPMQSPAPMPTQTPMATPASQPYPSPSTILRTTSLPNQEDLFRFDNDLALNARILKELDKKKETFPPVPPMVPAGTPFVPKTATYPPVQVLYDSSYVIHRRLYFEEKNSERAGWDAGPAQSVFSSAYFFRDCLLWPSRLTSHMHERYDGSAGKCRPGDATPYYYYPHGVSWFGAAVGGAFYSGIGFVFW
jgi:hypothetical protein